MNPTPMFVEVNKQFPRELLGKIFLELYEPPSYHDPQYGKVLRGTLAACRLVCRHWSSTVKLNGDGFVILAYNKKWPSPPVSWYILRRTPLVIQDGRRRNQESDTGWLSENYMVALAKWRLKFLPEFAPGIIMGLYRKWNPSRSYESWWSDEKPSVIQSTLAACCLVSHEWNTIFTPILYEEILPEAKNPIHSQSLLHHTFRHMQPARKVFVKAMTIALTKDRSTANLLSICFSLPNLRKLTLDFKNFSLSALHPDSTQRLRTLSKRCTIQMGDGGVDVEWGSLPSYINFMRRSKSTSHGFRTVCKLNGKCNTIFYLLIESYSNNNQDPICYSNTYFYTGKQEASTYGFIEYSGIERFRQHLTQTGHNLKGLYLNLYSLNTFLLPSKYVLSS